MEATRTATRAELTAYLDEHGLKDILVKVVEAILLEQPERPVEHIVNYLLVSPCERSFE